MAKKEDSNIAASKLTLYDQLMEANPAIVRKGDTVPYTSLNGHMFSYLTKQGELVLRLPKEEIEKFLKKYKTTLCEAYGVVQKEYVIVPDKLLENPKRLF